jgi:flagellar hook-basal body complex protein FliE
MSVEAVQGLAVHDEVAPAPSSLSSRLPASEVLPFSSRVAEGLQELNQQLLTNQRDLQQLAVGDAENLHEIMIRLEESRVSLQLMLQVRNRVLEAYQDVMRMQV